MVLAVAVGLLAACGSKQAATDKLPAPQLATLVVGGGSDASGQSWDGVVEAVQQAVISAQTGGRVASMAVDVNDHVAAGAVMLRLTAVEQQAGADTARAQLKASEAVLEEAESRFRRSSELAARQLVSRADYDLARAARDSAAAARDAARAQLQQAEQQTQYTVIRAPYAGVVSVRHVEPGEVVAPGQALLDFYAPGALRVTVQVPQTEAAKIRAAGPPSFVFADGRRVVASAMTVFPSADPVTHAVAVRVELPAMPDPPEPGMTAKVVFPVAGAGTQLLIPASAVVQRGEVSAVYVLSGTELSLRQLRLGERVGDDVRVVAGLTLGERIAADPIAATQFLAAGRQAAGRKHD